MFFLSVPLYSHLDLRFPVFCPTEIGGGGVQAVYLDCLSLCLGDIVSWLNKKSPATFLYYYPRGSLKRLGSPQQYMALIHTLVAFGAILHLGWVAILHGIWILFILVRVDALNNSTKKFKLLREGSQSTYTLKQSHLKTKCQMTSLNQVPLSRMWRQPKTHTHTFDTVLLTAGPEGWSVRRNTVLKQEPLLASPGWWKEGFARCYRVQTSASELGKSLLPARSCPDVSGGAATEDYITD
jgi:hypothetical protein